MARCDFDVKLDLAELSVMNLKPVPTFQLHAKGR
jgi:hypothetical protein